MKLRKLCLTLSIGSVIALGSFTSAMATDWVMKQPAGCNIMLRNLTHSYVTTQSYGGVTLSPVGHRGSWVTKRSLTGCSFGVPSPLGVAIYTKGLQVFTRYFHSTDTYLIRFSGDLSGSGASQKQCVVAGSPGNIVTTSNLHGTFCFSAPMYRFHRHS